MKLKLQGFELEIEGNREDASIIGRNIGEQISSMIAPAVNVIEGDAHADENPRQPSVAAITQVISKRKPARRAKGASEASLDNGATVEFRHDPARFGMPNQQWNTMQKAIWLLYVLREAANVNEASAGGIATTFNTYFRQAGTIRGSNVSRDLGSAKLTNPAPVGEDPTKTPAVWFLTDEGARRAQSAIAEALSGSGT